MTSALRWSFLFVASHIRGRRKTLWGGASQTTSKARHSFHGVGLFAFKTNTMTTPRKVFTIIVNDKQYDVWSIEGREHSAPNGEVNVWWLYYSERLPEGLIPPPDSEYFIPYHVSMERSLWDIRIKQSTTTKEKWDDIHFRSSTFIEIYRNNAIFYSFGTIGGDRGIAFGMAKAQYLITTLSEHCFNFYDPQSENGRKIYWKGLPAFVKVWRKDTPWEIGITPDYSEIGKEKWWSELSKRESMVRGLEDLSEEEKEEIEMDKEHFDEAKSSDFINWGDAYNDQHINWFRK